MTRPLAFITGASSGIGQALAWRYHRLLPNALFDKLLTGRPRKHRQHQA